uniref:F-box domain-containing protein n=1 Tax=Panagrolaimus davidi TaxID=227884 RepID=A0A914PQT3_9BILA
MDSPKSPSVEVQLQKSLIPTFLKQYYSLPSPIIKYMLENASAINYFKLFHTCKILQKFIQEKYGPQIDILEAGNFNHNSYFFSIHARNKEIKIRGSEKIYNEFPNNQKLWVRKHYKKLLVPSIELLYGNVCKAEDTFDIISYTLKSLPNLKVFRLPWNPNLTTFAELTSIKRDKKLEKAEIYDFTLESDKDNLNGFITEHMAPGSTLYLSFKFGVSKIAKNKYQNFADEFNKFSSSKIIIR